MNVLVISENFRKDHFILQPIISAMFTKLGKPANVRVMMDPLIGGFEKLNRELLKRVVERYKWSVDLFLLCVDRDGESDRRAALDAMEQHVNSLLAAPKFMIAENAWQELEVWVLAGHDLPSEWNWQEIRDERDPKEAYFERLVEARKLRDDPGGGRKTLGYEAARKYARIFSRCREDIQVLQRRVERVLADLAWVAWQEANQSA